MLYYFFDFPLILAVCLVVEVLLDWRSGVGWFQQRDVEHRMDLCILGQRESIVDRADSLRNEKWSDLDLVQFFRWSPCA
jgi:hypothetical protein